MNFRGAKFYSHYPDLTGAVLHENVVLSAESDYWHQIKQDDPKQARASCDALRHVVAKQGQVDAERFFFNREMKFATEVEALNAPRYLWIFWRVLSAHWWYGIVSDYGQSIKRPLRGLAFCLVVFAGLFHCFVDWDCVLREEPYSWGMPWGLSLSNLLSFLGMGPRYFGSAFYEDLFLWMVIASGTETVLGVVFLFFLGLGLRNRFRLK